MKTAVYYFSGTGNSFVAARSLAELLDADLISIPAVVGQDQIECSGDAFGIVFPVYYETLGGIPLIVRRFIDKLVNIESKYIFSVCTYGSAETVTLKNVSRLIEGRGGTVSARISVNMPENIYPKLARKKHARMFTVWKSEAEKVSKIILDKKKGVYRTPNVVVGPFYGPLRVIGRGLRPCLKNSTIRQLQRYTGSQAGSFEELLPIMDKSFAATEACTDCGTCARICPAGNIRRPSGRPEWQHRCEFCLACYHWCPAQAIECSAVKGAEKYHHPDAGLADMRRSAPAG